MTRPSSFHTIQASETSNTTLPVFTTVSRPACSKNFPMIFNSFMSDSYRHQQFPSLHTASAVYSLGSAINDAMRGKCSLLPETLESYEICPATFLISHHQYTKEISRTWHNDLRRPKNRTNPPRMPRILNLVLTTNRQHLFLTKLGKSYGGASSR
jgi:hypothetical protein